MTGRPLLTRRNTLAAGAALLGQSAKADTDDRQRITLGSSTFVVPKPYLFGEFMPAGATEDGLPPLFSFAFTAPNGAPAGEGIEFPPMSHPFVLERDNGQFLVMCYRVSASASEPKPLHVPPRGQLANTLTSTAQHVYSKEDDALIVKYKSTDLDEQRYVSLIDNRNGSGIEAFLTYLSGAQFFYGAAQFEKPHVTTVVYVPQERHVEIGAALAKASDLLLQWKER